MKNKYIIIGIAMSIIATIIAAFGVVIQFIDLYNRADDNIQKQKTETRLLQEILKEYDGLLFDFTYDIAEHKSIERSDERYYLVTIYRDVWNDGEDAEHYMKFNHAVDFYLCKTNKGDIDCDYIGTQYFKR